MTRAHGRARVAGAAAILLVMGLVTACSSNDAASEPSPVSSAASSAPAQAPQPVPASDVALKLPQDMYLHEGAPTEWWWHTGTLRAGDRTFGFEINAAGFDKDDLAFTQIMLTDVASQRHYKRTTLYSPGQFSPTSWAQSDASKDWYARLGDAKNQLGGVQLTAPGTGYTTAPKVAITGDGTGAKAVATLGSDGQVAAVSLLSAGKGYTTPPKVTITGDGTGAKAVAFPTYVAMSAPAADPTKDMHVKALLSDDPSLTPVSFDLTMSQEGRPFYVWGTGANPMVKSASLEENNYYFSLTRMHAKGTITIDGEAIPVEGITWMDHEYGEFGTSANPVKWILQDMQLDNGFSISNVGILTGGLQPALDTPMQGYATLESADGSTYLVASSVTPFGTTWKSDASGTTYFTKLRVQIPSFGADIVVSSLMDAQEFPASNGGSVYEGVAKAEGRFQDADVTGTAWIEQAS